MTPDEFANLVGLSREGVETYRSLGLLHPEQDGLLDDVDLVRLGFVRHRLAQDAYNPESLAVAIREGRVDSMYGRRLFEADSPRESVSKRTSSGSSRLRWDSRGVRASPTWRSSR